MHLPIDLRGASSPQLAVLALQRGDRVNRRDAGITNEHAAEKYPMPLLGCKHLGPRTRA